MFTNGFISDSELTDHFDKHWREFGNPSLDEDGYLAMADQFLGEGRCGTIVTVRCRGGDTIRYDPKTQEFGILSAERYIRTYYLPDPAKHRKGSNYEYFLIRCLD